MLLKKTGRAEVAIEPDYVGFEIPDRFVIGYGLDFDGGWRHLPYLAALDPDEIEAASCGHDISGSVDAGRTADTP